MPAGSSAHKQQILPWDMGCWITTKASSLRSCSIPTHSLLWARVAFVKMISDHGHFLLKTLQWLLEPSKEVQTVLHPFFSVLIFIPLHHFIPQITWILSCQETKDGQASQETGAGSIGSSVPIVISMALPAICPLFAHCLSLPWCAQKGLRHSSLV